MRDRSVSTEDSGTRSGKREIGAISVRSWGAISMRISPELGGLGLVGQPELGVGLCVELRLVCGLELK